MEIKVQKLIRLGYLTTMFDEALKYTLQFEGGYVNNKLDPGGATYKGVTQKTYDDFRDGRQLDKRSVRVMSTNELKDIYQTLYWDPVCRKIKDDNLAIVAFDSAVNHGPGRAKKWLEETQDPTKYLDLREQFYHDIVKNKPSQSIFLKGWLNRIEGLRKIISEKD